MHGIVGNSNFTQSVIDVVNRIDGNSPTKDSLFEQAKTFFVQYNKDEQELSSLNMKLASLSNKLENASKKENEKLQSAFKKTKQAHNLLQERLESERIFRLENVHKVCEKIIRLAEAENWEKTQTASARVLGTLQLICPTDGKNVHQLKQKYKPAYKAVLAMRLTDKLLANEQTKLQYIRSKYIPEKRYAKEDKILTTYQIEVLIPLVIACIFQDVGLLHPLAQELIKGKGGQQDTYRVLEKEDRMRLLQLNHKYTIEYIIKGLGVPKYVGNSKPEREIFNHLEAQKLAFVKGLLVGALKPKDGIGNLVKVPQIYTSFIFSSKPNQSLADLPKAMLLIQNAAQRSSISKLAVDSLMSILGHFPQGFGITYITQNEDGSQSDDFEYAIVVGLNPRNPFVPICRTATRNLLFTDNGKVLTIETKNNLYFAEPRKLLEKINPERLHQILKKLSSNYEERKALSLVPDHWDPHEFFQYEKLQNLWKQS